MNSKRKSYTSKFKLSVVRYAEEHNNCAAAREFTVSESNVRLWKRDKLKLEQMPRNKRALRGSDAHFPEMERELLVYVEEKRSAGLAVSPQQLRLKAKMLARKVQHDINAYKSFKASQNWCYRFMGRHHLSVRKRTTIAQRLPDDHEDKLLNFQKYVIKQRKEHNYPLSLIGNADQTPMTFDLPSDYTVDRLGSKSVSIKTTGNEKNRFTIMLACMADGTKLPPYIVFKRKTPIKGNVPGVIIRQQAKGWMDDALVRDWINIVWRNRVGGLSRQKSLLVLDAFRCHRDENTKKLLKAQHNTDIAIIPGGMTSILQPLDVSVNKPFKVLMRKRWQQWMEDGDHTFTAGGKMRKVTELMICQWIKDAWKELDISCIVNGFKKTCISNKLDGSEDDLLWNDEEQPEVTENNNADDDDDLFYNDMDIAQLRENDIILRDLFDKEDSDSENSFKGF